MPKAPRPQFPGWNEEREGVYVLIRKDMSLMLLVTKLDGWNWGWMALNPEGEIHAGEMNSKIDIWAAIEAADKYLATYDRKPG